jgi:hypothetical protein
LFDLKLELNPLSTYQPPKTIQDIVEEVFNKVLVLNRPLACVRDESQLVYDASPSAKNKTDQTTTLDSIEDDKDDFEDIFQPSKMASRKKNLLEKFNEKTRVEDEVSQSVSLKK